MANVFTNLPVPAGDGVGAPVDVSGLGKTKTFTVQGTLVGTITIEISHDGVDYFPLKSFSRNGKWTAEFAAYYFRIRVSGYQSGVGNVDVGSEDFGQQFLALPAPAADGTGASTDVSALGTLNTITVAGAFTGTVTIEISEDNVAWAQCMSFTNPGHKTLSFVAQYMRVRRSGTRAGAPGAATVNVGAVNDPVTTGLIADFLGTTGAPVNVGASAPPAAGYVLVATGAATATWQAGAPLVNPLLLGTGYAYVYGSPAYASVAIGHGFTSSGGTAEISVNPANSGVAFGTSYGLAGALGIGRIHATQHGAVAHGVAYGYNPYTAEIESNGFGSLAFGDILTWGGFGTIQASGSGSLAFGTVAAGGNGGGITSRNEGDLAGGYVYQYAPYGGVINASQSSIAHGIANGATIYANALGSMARGFANGGARIYTSGYGASAGGRAYGNNSDILATGHGAHAMGYTKAAGEIEAAALGACASGYAYGSGAQVYSNGSGAHALGYAYVGYGTGGVHADGAGAFAAGFVNGQNSALWARLAGSIALGYAYDGGSVEARYQGSVVIATAYGAGSYAQDLSRSGTVLGRVQGGGLLSTNGYGAMARGFVDGAGSQLTSGDRGSLASGYAIDSGDLLVLGTGCHGHGDVRDGALLGTAAGSAGSFAGGYAHDGASQIYARERGCFAFGEAQYEGDVTARGDGSFALGLADGTATYGRARIYAYADGALAQGAARSTVAAGAYYSRIQATGPGSFARGKANEIGEILASGVGASAGGYVNSSGISAAGQIPATIEATALGAFAHGVAVRELTAGARSYMQATAAGCWAGGYSFGYSAAYRGRVAATYKGAMAHGYARDGQLRAQQIGAHALGRVNGEGAEIGANGVGSFASGSAEAAGTIIASGPGSFAAGLALAGYNVVASGDSSFAFGRAYATDVRATGRNSFQFCEGTNAVNDSLQIGSNFLAKANGQFGGVNTPITLGNGVTTFAVTSNVMTITGDAGSNTIATITGGISGEELTLIFVDGLVTITDDGTHAADTVDLSAAFTSADDTVLKLVYDGTSWYEVSRSTN